MAREPFNRLWAESPDQFEEPIESIWGAGWKGGPAEDPPEAKWQNWWQNRVDYALRDVERRGALLWLDDVPYKKLARAYGSDGEVYTAIQDNQNVDPTTDDGTNWVKDRAPSPLGFLLEEEGYYSLPGGLLLQWMNVGDGSSITADTSGTFNLPIDFSTQAFGAIATIRRSSPVSGNWGCYAEVTTSQVTVSWDADANGSGAIQKRAFVIAIGK